MCSGCMLAEVARCNAKTCFVEGGGASEHHISARERALCVTRVWFQIGIARWTLGARFLSTLYSLLYMCARILRAQ